MITSIFGGFSSTSYSENIGLLGLTRVQGRLLLSLHRRQGFALGLPVSVELTGASDQFFVLIGPLSGTPRGQPIAEGLSRGPVVGLCRLLAQARLVQRVLCLAPGELRRFNGLFQRRRPLRVQKIVQRLPLFHLGQVTHDGAAQPHEEPGKHKGHQPEATAKPLF